MSDRVETIRGLYSAFAEADGDRLGQLLADTHWVEAAGMPYGGTYREVGAAGPLEAAFAHLWTVRDGRITHFVQFADTHLFRQAVGA